MTDAETADTRGPDRNAASSREEEAAEMEDPRARDRAADFREAAVRVRKALRLIGVVRALAWAAAVVSAAASAMAEAMRDRVPDTEITDRAKASLERAREKIRKNAARMKRDAQAIRSEIRDPGRIIFMRKTRLQRTAPAVLSNLKRKKRKQRKR